MQAHFPGSLAQVDLGTPELPVRSPTDENSQIKLFPFNCHNGALFHLQPWLLPLEYTTEIFAMHIKQEEERA